MKERELYRTMKVWRNSNIQKGWDKIYKIRHLYLQMELWVTRACWKRILA